MRFLFLFVVTCAVQSLLFGAVGTVKASYPVPFAQPFGLAARGADLFVSDRATGQYRVFSPLTGSFGEPRTLPAERAWGIAADAKGLVWVSDRDTKRILRFDPKTGRSDKVLSELESDAAGLAWSPDGLWVTAGDKVVLLDPEDGTEKFTFTGSSKDMSGVFFDGKYLWLADRINDRIVVALPDGTIFGAFPSPGPYPAGLVRSGDTLWVLDFEKRTLFALDLSFSVEPYYLGEPHRRMVFFSDTLFNRGPSSDAIGRIYVAVGENGPHQRILDGPSFVPQKVSFVQDMWGQRFAALEGLIPVGKNLSLGYLAVVETRDLNYFILPEWVKGLEAIPADIRAAYTKDGTKLMVNDPVVRDLVKQIVGNEKNPFWIAFKIHKYLHENIAYERTGGWNAAPVILKRGTGSCSEFSFAFIALARAAGLPARYEAGVVVRQDEGSVDEVYHRWPQVYLPPFGWVPVDPSKGKPATPYEVATSFGSLSHRFFVTTHGGGDSAYLGWTYNANAFYEFSGRAVIEERAEAKWEPLPAPAKP